MNCIETVPDNYTCQSFHQCKRRAKFGQYCGIHWKAHKDEIAGDPNMIIRANKIEGKINLIYND
jgi:hypothetical protein